MDIQPPREPFNYGLATYFWVFALSVLGGVVRFMRKVKMGMARVFNLTEFIGEIVTSAFVGIITFWLCEGAHMNAYFTAAMIGISGHMGSRAIFLLEDWAENIYKRLAGHALPDEEARDGS